MDLLDTVRRRIEIGDREGARRELASVLRADPHSVPAWLLLADLIKDPAQQADCYRQILRLDPENRQAAARLGTLTNETPESNLESQPLPNVFDNVFDDAKEATSLRSPQCGGTTEEGLRAFDEKTIQRLKDRQVTVSQSQSVIRPQIHTKKSGLLAGLLRLLGLRVTGLQTSTGHGDFPQQGQLSPDDVIELAGGPLAPEERQRCPQCAAVVPRSAVKCPWCGTSLSGTRDE